MKNYGLVISVTAIIILYLFIIESYSEWKISETKSTHHHQDKNSNCLY